MLRSSPGSIFAPPPQATNETKALSNIEVALKERCEKLREEINQLDFEHDLQPGEDPLDALDKLKPLIPAVAALMDGIQSNYSTLRPSDFSKQLRSLANICEKELPGYSSEIASIYSFYQGHCTNYIILLEKAKVHPAIIAPLKKLFDALHDKINTPFKKAIAQSSQEAEVSEDDIINSSQFSNHSPPNLR